LVDLRKKREQQFHDVAYSERRRAPTAKFYTVVEQSRHDFKQLIAANCRGKQVLEYGCGPGGVAFYLAQLGANVTGIDISPVAIRKAQLRAKELGLDKQITFLVMDAEQLEFKDNSFDIVCGISILHHLDLARAYGEIARVLDPSGRAFFLEPLGYNWLINVYRRVTPQYRTADEHPLVRKDFVLARQFFAGLDVTYHHLSAIAAVPFRGKPGFHHLLRALNFVDGVLLKIPGIKWLAWLATLSLYNPRKYLVCGSRKPFPSPTKEI